MNAGRVASNRRGFGQDLLALRDYEPQDDLRYIDWKATAKSSRLTVREFSSEDERRVTIAMDIVARRDIEPKEFLARFEQQVTHAASLISHFVAEGAELRLVLGDEIGAFGVGREHMHKCLRRLALVAPAAEENKPGPGTGTFRSLVSPSGQTPDRGFIILLTTAPQGTIPSEIWRSAHVLYF
jgi:uncharacterized protein (DUF58 family)